MSIFNSQLNVSEPEMSEEIDLPALIDFVKQATIPMIFGASFIGLTAYIVIAATPPKYSADAIIQIEEKAAGFDLGGMMPLSSEVPETATESELVKSRMILSKAINDTEFSIEIKPKKLFFVADYLARALNFTNQSSDFLKSYSLGKDTIEISKFVIEEALQDSVFTVRALSSNQYLLFGENETEIGVGTTGKALTSEGKNLNLLITSINAAPGTEFLIKNKSMFSAIEELKSNLSVAGVGRKTDLLKIQYTSNSKDEALDLTNAIQRAFIRQNIRRGSQEAENGIQFLSKQIPIAKSEMNSAEDTLNEFQLSRNTVDINFETETILGKISALESKAETLKSKEAEISKQYTKNHPTYAALLDVREQIVDDLSNVQGQIESLPNTQQEMLKLARELQLKQEVYIKMLTASQELSIAKAGAIGNVRLIDDAALNPRPVNGNKHLKLLLSVLLGILAGAAYTFLRQNAGRGVVREEQIETTGIPVLATLPLSDAQSKLSKKRADKQSVLARYAPSDLSIEALRSLRTSMLFGSLAGGSNKNIMISGTSPGTGKSFLSANLAAVCAELGERVLLIDADLRKGYLHTSFAIDNDNGLAEYLSDSATLEDSLRYTGIEGLDIITRGKIPPNPAELLCNKKFEQLLAEVADRYDRIIIDTPPILAVTDAAIIGRHCSRSLLLIRWGKTHQKEIEHSINRFNKCNIKIDGAILNGIEKTAGSYEAYGYYQYNYGEK